MTEFEAQPVNKNENNEITQTSDTIRSRNFQVEKWK